MRPRSHSLIPWVPVDAANAANAALAFDTALSLNVA